MAHKIDTPAARAKLAARRSPYWHKIGPNRFIGWRYLTPGTEGTWSAKVQAGRSDQHLPFGKLDTIPPKDRFAEALRMGMKWFSELELAGTVNAPSLGHRMTLMQALEAYCISEGKRTKEGHPEFGPKTAQANRRRFDNWVAPYVTEAGVFMVNKPLVRITALEWKQWRDWLYDQPSKARGADPLQAREPSSNNRDLSAVLAAVNMAAELHKLPAAWRGILEKAEEDDTGLGPEAYLTTQQRAHLLQVMGKHEVPRVQAARALALTMCMSPIRPGALSVMRVQHYDPKAHALNVFKGADKIKKGRVVHLPRTPELLALFKALCKDKLPSAFLFTDDVGDQWRADNWCDAMRRARITAKLPGATLYWLRHSRITDLANSGLPGTSALAIAAMAGTSVAMIEKHYFKARGDQQASAQMLPGF